MSKDYKKTLTVLQEIWPKLDLLGIGGNSWVFSTVPDGEREVVKVLRRLDPPSKYKRFRNEIVAAKKLADIEGVVPLRHENLPDQPKLDGAATSVPYFVMPFFPNTLEKRIGHGPAIDGGVGAVALFMEIARIIQEMHRRGVAHRDLKPDNILLDKNERPHIADFGLCLDLAAPDEVDSRLTATEEIVGPLLYRAPEYLRGRLDDRDHRPGDVFSLGRILWALLTGNHPSGLSDDDYLATPISERVTGLRRPGILNQMILDAANPVRQRRVGIESLIAAGEEWKRDPSTLAVLPRIKQQLDDHPQLTSMRQRDKDAARMASTLERLKQTLTSAINSSAFVIGLSELSPRPGVNPVMYTNSRFAGLGVSEMASVISVIGMQFNVGDIELMPRLLLQCQISRLPGAAECFLQIAAGANRSSNAGGETQPIKVWSLGPYAEVTASTMAEIEATIREALAWLEAILANDWDQTRDVK